MFDNPRSDDIRVRDDWRDRDSRDREVDPRDVFMEGLDLPRGLQRELVHDRDREYSLRGSESRTLSVVGAFRVVSSRDLLDHHDRPADPPTGDLRHLREQGLIRTVPLHGHRDVAVVLTDRGRDVLESHRRDRDGGHDHRQEFYAELKKAREAEHDVQIYRAPTSAKRRASRNVAPISDGSPSTTSSSGSTSSSYRSGTVAVRTVMVVLIVTSQRSRIGRGNTTCRTSMGTFISPMRASSTKNLMAAGITWISRS